MQGDRLKRTIALRLDRVRTAANARAFGERLHAKIGNRFQRRRRSVKLRRVRCVAGFRIERSQRRQVQLCDELRGPTRFVVVDAACIARDHPGGSAQQKRRHFSRKAELARGARARHVVIALPGERQQRMRLRRARPAIGGKTGDP